MNDAVEAGWEQVDAARSLLSQSGLVRFDPHGTTMSAVDVNQFESTLASKHSRLISWILFSAGAEFLAKGACLVNGIDLRESKQVPREPIDPLATWRGNLLNGSEDKIQTIKFGTLGDLTAKPNGHLYKLCESMDATAVEKSTLLAGYVFLQRSVRNRDAHAYVPNVRGRQFALVEKLFIESFNILLRWLPAHVSVPSQ